VISNLLINSIEAMPQGGSMTVSGRNIEMTAVPPFEKRSIQIVIRDDGHGIAREHLARIFDPYFSTKQRGSGLGLATAYSIVRRHEGRLIAESELGQGTTFRIFLPASESQPKKSVEATAPVVDGSARVLVMDDEPAVREVIGAVLAERGYEIEFAEDGSQAIARYYSTMHEGCPFDVVILDLTVRGGMGGQEAMRRLKELDPDVKAIVVSGYSSDPVMARYSDYGFSGCVQKPFQTEELIRVVAEVAAIPTPSTD
jgi:CheY-like chemotaxis protein